MNDQTGDEDEERFFVLKTFTVFSADQVEGEAAGQYQVHEDEGQPQAEPDFQPAEEMIVGTKADIRYGGDRAYYRRPLPAGSFPHHREGDFIVMPPRATFDPPGAFYETAIHELAHWSEVRTGWDRQAGYALGELAAEIASCYVAAELGIPQGEGLGNHAAYLRSWLDAIRRRPQLRLQGGEAGIQGHGLPAGLRPEARTGSGGGDAMSETIVIFRKDVTGEPFALFPELPGDDRGFLCTGYQHFGHHAAADYDLCIARSDPAAPAEYADLFDELERRGYILAVRSRATPEMHERRRRIAAERRARSSEKQVALATR